MSYQSSMPTVAGMDPSALYGAVEQQLQGYGNAEQAAAYQTYQNTLGQAKQQEAASGLAGTSIAPSVASGFMKQYQLGLNALNQQLTQTQLGAQSTFGLGGIQLGLQGQQQATQTALGLGNLGVNQQYANAAMNAASNQSSQQGQSNDAAIYAQQAQVNNQNVAGGGNYYPGSYSAAAYG
jgi:hypothetical protein